MYLKRLVLHGFKSFAPRTVLEFSPGITAVVGPNGSGKSNIADSIRWVLGEQSMRQLRGKKSDDVIFAGGAGRSAMQMAEVGLVLDNSAGWLPSEFSEVTVSRRSFRSGESEYLMNGQRVRLRDVLLLLAQARIGHDSYTVIGQGLVDQALSARADERRALFEDAAGIRQFQVQRTDAEQKLALTQGNLSRLHDILGEIEPRLAPLAEQARRARDYTGAREELVALSRMWYRRQWSELQRQRAQAESTEQASERQAQAVQESLMAHDARISELRVTREEVVAELSGFRRERGDASGQLQVTERDLAVARERLASLDRQRSDIEAEQGQQEEAIAAAQAHIDQLEAQVASADDQARQMAESLAGVERQQHAARQEQEREEARLRATQRDVIQVQARLGAAQTELGRLQRQLGDRNRVLATRKEAVAAGQKRHDVAAAQLATLRDTFEASHREIDGLSAQREQVTQQLAAGQAEIERLRGEVADAERERRASAERLALLEDWRRSLAGASGGVRALLDSQDETRPPVVGLLGSLIATQPSFEVAVEAALGMFLHAVVVANREDALLAARWLRAGGKERALFLWLDHDAPNEAPRVAAPANSDWRIVGLARDAVQARPEIQRLVRQLLGETMIVASLEVAQELFGESPVAPVVTIDGDVLHPQGWLSGGGVVKASDGSARDASVLARERALRRLPAELERIEHEIGERQAQHARTLATQAERKLADERIRADLQRLEAAAQETARQLATSQREQERAANEMQLSMAVAEQLAAEIVGLEQEVAATTARVGDYERAQVEATERVEDIQAEADELIERGRVQQEELAKGRTALVVAQQEAKALAQRSEQVRVQKRELEIQIARRGDRLGAITTQHAELIETLAAYEGAIGDLRERVREASDHLRAHEARQTEIERLISEAERQSGAQRQELVRLEGEYRRCLLETQRARDAVEALAQQIREELADESDPDPLLAFIEGEDEPQPADAEPQLSAEDASKMRRQIDQLRARLKNLGGYDPDAPQAYEELKTRHDFLTAQVRDMEQAIANLRSIITELDTTMRRQFEETFRAVNERFQRHFTVLFSGGAARLELTAPRKEQADDDEDGAATPTGVPRKVGFGGVEVFVQIPGKKVQDLSLLSGGERAMVSAALLFALLETNPPPFCLLDEVDAALDEANVVRFCDILKILAEHTQFIVITHNRVTMTHADAIYGVSMQADSVSRVLSMKLAELAAMR